MSATSDAAPAPAAPATASPTCRIIVMCSGGGTNFQAVLDAVAAGRIASAASASVVRMIYNKKDAYARTRAERAHPPVPADYFNLVSRGFQAPGERDPQRKREARARYDAALAAEVLAHRPDLIVLAGWMHVFSEAFLVPVQEAGVRVINLHPALPGKYDGAAAIERAFQDFRDGKLENNRTGVMVHYTIAEVDRGAPIVTQEVECLPDDTLESLESRMHAVEHELIVRATAQVVAEILARKRQA